MFLGCSLLVLSFPFPPSLPPAPDPPPQCAIILSTRRRSCQGQSRLRAAIGPLRRIRFLLNRATGVCTRLALNRAVRTAPRPVGSDIALLSFRIWLALVALLSIQTATGMQLLCPRHFLAKAKAGALSARFGRGVRLLAPYSSNPAPDPPAGRTRASPEPRRSTSYRR